ncbi:MAG TPA: hypothetical protein VJV75_06205 [Candidatus Polarisedimenticolia bacterium]|nr:hypothetical protein [Candidatus Polarisedimenticolia bacterium]
MPTPTQAVRQARLVALAILAGQIVFLAITVMVNVFTGVGPGADPADRPDRAAVAGGGPGTLLAVALFLFAVLVPIAFLLRRRLITAEAGGVPPPDLYLKGQIVFFALCEIPTLVFLVVALVQGNNLAALLAIPSMGVQALNMPKDSDLKAA